MAINIPESDKVLSMQIIKFIRIHFLTLNTNVQWFNLEFYFKKDCHNYNHAFQKIE